MKPDDIPQWAWDEADDTTYNIETDGHGSIEYTEARASIARLVMKARSKAFEEAAKIADCGCNNPGCERDEIAQAIRQHSQKGRDNP